MSDAAARAQDLYQKIKDLLLGEWDPIGVRGIPEAQDEYDGYIPTLCSMLIARKTVHEMFDYLLWIETERMGLEADRQHTQSVAEKLVGLTG